MAMPVICGYTRERRISCMYLVYANLALPALACAMLALHTHTRSCLSMSLSTPLDSSLMICRSLALATYLCCSPTIPRQITLATSSSVGQVRATQPNRPHASRNPVSSAFSAPVDILDRSDLTHCRRKTNACYAVVCPDHVGKAASM